MGVLHKCGTCQVAKPVDEFERYYHPERKKHYRRWSRCKECNKNRLVEYRKNISRDTEKALRRKEQKRNINLIANYGVTLEDYYKILKDQAYCCAICHDSWIDAENDREWPLDHCHKTGIIRGILCFNCNALLGHSKDDEDTLLNAISYLRKYKKGSD